MGRIEEDIAPESWLFEFRPCLALFGTGTVYPIGCLCWSLVGAIRTMAGGRL